MNGLKAPFLNYAKLREIAKAVIDRYHASRSLPIPIEEIIEFQFGLDIIPIPGLQRIIEVDAFLSQDLKTIAVDEAVYNGRQRRYRFSLAHELGHLVLHKDIYKELSSNSIVDWKKNIQRLPDKEYSLLEWQAQNFAGLLLIPPEELAREVKRVLATLVKNGNEAESWPYLIAAELADAFDVSPKSVEIRIEKDGLLK